MLEHCIKIHFHEVLRCGVCERFSVVLVVVVCACWGTGATRSPPGEGQRIQQGPRRQGLAVRGTQQASLWCSAFNSCVFSLDVTLGVRWAWQVEQVGTTAIIHVVTTNQCMSPTGEAVKSCLCSEHVCCIQ